MQLPSVVSLDPRLVGEQDAVRPILSTADPTSKAESVGYARELEIACAGLKEMHKRGIKVLPGGDYGWVFTDRFGLTAQVRLDPPWDVPRS